MMLQFGYGIVLDGLPDIPEFHFFFWGPVRISNVVFTFQKSLNVWKDICLEAKHVGAHLMDQMNLNAVKNKSIWMFTEPNTISLFCLFMCMYFFLLYYPTLSLLCMSQSYYDNLFCGWTSSCFFI